MKLPDREVKTIIDGLLPLLAPVFEETTVNKTVEGRQLIYQGVTKDEKGKQIQPAGLYTVNKTVKTEVNHGRHLRKVIEMAKDKQGLEDDLARYLIKFGQSKEAISASINTDLQNQINTDHE